MKWSFELFFYLLFLNIYIVIKHFLQFLQIAKTFLQLLRKRFTLKLKLSTFDVVNYPIIVDRSIVKIEILSFLSIVSLLHVDINLCASPTDNLWEKQNYISINFSFKKCATFYLLLKQFCSEAYVLVSLMFLNSKNVI